MIPSGAQIWIVAGVTDMRYGLTGLSAKVQNVLHESPLSGQAYIFRGRRGELLLDNAFFLIEGHPQCDVWERVGHLSRAEQNQARVADHTFAPVLIVISDGSIVLRAQVALYTSRGHYS